MVYLPTVLFSLGEGAVIPLIPVIAARMGADVAFAALVASALVVGQLCGNLPAGWAVARIGERFTMVIAGVVSMLAAAGMIFAPSIGVLAASVFLLGFCAAAFGLARHAFMTTRVPVAFRRGRCRCSAAASAWESSSVRSWRRGSCSSSTRSRLRSGSSWAASC